MKVLIVEDDIDLQKAMKRAFEDQGIEVDQAFDYFTANKFMRKIDEKEYNIILWDGVIGQEPSQPNELVLTIPLIKKARDLNKEVWMIAMSNNEDLRKQQVAVGCNEAMDKGAVVKAIIKRFSIHRPS